MDTEWLYLSVLDRYSSTMKLEYQGNVPHQSSSNRLGKNSRKFEFYDVRRYLAFSRCSRELHQPPAGGYRTTLNHHTVWVRRVTETIAIAYSEDLEL